MNKIENRIYTKEPAYNRSFWNVMRGKELSSEKIEKGRNTDTGTYDIPSTSQNKYVAELDKISLFRNLGSVISAPDSGYRIFAKDSDDLVMWVKENASIPIYDGINDFTINTLDSYKLAALIKLDDEFVHDATFDIEDYLIKRLAKNFGKAEDNAFINGNGEDMPTGILADDIGAKTGVTSVSIAYDNVISLYFSLKPEYRKNAVWLMNDKTALSLRTLKDDAGNYLWRDSNDTILGKNVVFSEHMPDAVPTNKPIVFGNFPYYWVIIRKPVSLRSLTEKFAVNNQIGYLAFEFLDGKLIRPEAIKVIEMIE